MHTFELPISLSVLEKYGGPKGLFRGYMARKQKIEATMGFKVPDNDGRRHALTLSVSDYNRRRGLL
jgi:RNA polymerase-associated protein RTF1